MKILMRMSSMGAGLYIQNGMAKALRNLGHDVVVCQGGEIHNLIHSFQPDLFFSSVSFKDDLDPYVLNQYPEMQIVTWVHHYSKDKVPKHVLPACTTQDDVDILSKIKNLKAVICHFGQPKANELLEKWKELGVKIISIPPAADVSVYQPCEPKEEYRCQLGYVGGYWAKKAHWGNFAGLDAYFKPLLQKYQFKIYGWGWPNGSSYGSIPFGHDRYVFNSAQICPNLHEIHSRYLGCDVVERTFKLPACKAFQVADYVEEINDYFTEDEIVMAQDVKEYHEKIEYYLKHPEERKPFVENAYKRVMRDHTYENRINDFFEKLGGNNNGAKDKTGNRDNI